MNACWSCDSSAQREPGLDRINRGVERGELGLHGLLATTCGLARRAAVAMTFDGAQLPCLMIMGVSKSSRSEKIPGMDLLAGRKIGSVMR